MIRIIGVLAVVAAVGVFAAQAVATGDFCKNNPDHRKCQTTTTTPDPEPIPVSGDVEFKDPYCFGSIYRPAELDWRVVTPGITYSQTGTPGPGETVTVTATADPGYVLVGQTVWTHTFFDFVSDCAYDPPAPPHESGTTGGTTTHEDALPHTGAPIWLYVLIAWVLIIGGAVLFWAGREPDDDPEL